MMGCSIFFPTENFCEERYCIYVQGFELGIPTFQGAAFFYRGIGGCVALLMTNSRVKQLTWNSGVALYETSLPELAFRCMPPRTLDHQPRTLHPADAGDDGQRHISLGMQPRVKSLRSSYTGLYPQTVSSHSGHPSRVHISRIRGLPPTGRFLQVKSLKGVPRSQKTPSS